MVKRTTTVAGENELMAKIQSHGYSFTEAFNVGMEVLLGAAGNDLEKLRNECAELKKERDSIDARLEVIEDKITRLEAEETEKRQEIEGKQEQINKAVEDIHSYIRKCRFEDRPNPFRIKHLSEVHGLSKDTITDLIKRQASEDEVAELIEKNIEAKAE